MASTIDDLERRLDALQTAAALGKKDDRIAAASSAGVGIDPSASADVVTAASECHIMKCHRGFMY